MDDGPRAHDRQTPQEAADELRRDAEQILDGLADTSRPPIDVAAALHELRVHQIELEMQNEELRRAQLELDEQREKYFELFDLAPVGYLTITGAGIVRDANLTAAKLLGVERQLLVENRSAPSWSLKTATSTTRLSVRSRRPASRNRTT